MKNKMTEEDKLTWMKKSDSLADKIMDMVDSEPMGVAHLAVTKALCFILDAVAGKDKIGATSLRNFSSQAINKMWESGKPPIPPVKISEVKEVGKA